MRVGTDFVGGLVVSLVIGNNTMIDSFGAFCRRQDMIASFDFQQKPGDLGDVVAAQDGFDSSRMDRLVALPYLVFRF